MPKLRPVAIKGDDGLVKTHLLSDKMTVITKDSGDKVSLWNIWSGKKIKDLGQVDFQAEIDRHETVRFLPTWCELQIDLQIV